MIALALILTLASGTQPGVHLESRAQRGWLTGAGLLLAGGGAVALSLAAYQGSQSDAAARVVAAYYSHGAAPAATEAAHVRWLQDRVDSGANQALALLISGGAALLLGIGLVLLDGRSGHTSVALAIQPSGASVLVRGRF